GGKREAPVARRAPFAAMAKRQQQQRGARQQQRGVAEARDQMPVPHGVEGPAPSRRGRGLLVLLVDGSRKIDWISSVLWWARRNRPATLEPAWSPGLRASFFPLPGLRSPSPRRHARAPPKKKGPRRAADRAAAPPWSADPAGRLPRPRRACTHVVRFAIR